MANRPGEVYAPTAEGERIDALDVARGFALLGILIMNATGMALWDTAYFNPAVDGGATGADFAAWLFMAVYAEGSMRTLFSLLFGAGMMLFLTRLEARPGALQPVDVHARRMLWLLAFGLCNSFVILYPYDILQLYAIAGLFLFPFRMLSRRGLAVLAGVLLALAVGWNGLGGYFTLVDYDEFRGLVAAQDAGAELTEEELETIEGWSEQLDFWYAADEQRAEMLALRTERQPLALWSNLAGEYVQFYTSRDFWGYLLDAAAAIALGMALFRAGVMTGGLGPRGYWLMLLAGYGIGLALGAWRCRALIVSDYDFLALEPHWALYDARRVALALGHVALVHLACAYDVLAGLRRLLATIGRMALTNYLTQSVMQVFAFYGLGLALHQRLQRHEVLYVVLVIWLFQAAFSVYWMRRYRFGPMEWLWRSLTYWRRQPLRRALAPRPAAASD